MKAKTVKEKPKAEAKMTIKEDYDKLESLKCKNALIKNPSIWVVKNISNKKMSEVCIHSGFRNFRGNAYYIDGYEIKYGYPNSPTDLAAMDLFFNPIKTLFIQLQISDYDFSKKIKEENKPTIYLEYKTLTGEAFARDIPAKFHPRQQHKSIVRMELENIQITNNIGIKNLPVGKTAVITLFSQR